MSNENFCGSDDSQPYNNLQIMKEFISEKYSKFYENFELTNFISAGGTGKVFEGYLKRAKKKQNLAFKFKISEKKLDKDSQEISILKIGGNKRFNDFVKEYGIKEDQNKEFKYHLKLANYYRALLLAELNKENNLNEYEQLLNNKPNPEIGLQIMESVTVDSINQAQQQQSEIYKDASALAGKIGGFLSSLGSALNSAMDQYGINQTISNAKDKISAEAKSFGESHPTIQNAATTAMEGIKTAGNFVVETAKNIVNSEPVQNITQKANEQYQAVMNSETVKNLSKKAEEQYISLKAKAVEQFGNANNQPHPQV